MTSFFDKKMTISAKLAQFIDLDKEGKYSPHEIMGMLLGRAHIYEKEYIDYLKDNKSEEGDKYLKQVVDNNQIS